ncbi:hypothetical protein F4703DRAFT_1818898, partial [Phycomyces blakesleeanus]
MSIIGQLVYLLMYHIYLRTPLVSYITDLEICQPNSNLARGYDAYSEGRPNADQKANQGTRGRGQVGYRGNYTQGRPVESINSEQNNTANGRGKRGGYVPSYGRRHSQDKQKGPLDYNGSGTAGWEQYDSAVRGPDGIYQHENTNSSWQSNGYGGETSSEPMVHDEYSPSQSLASSFYEDSYSSQKGGDQVMNGIEYNGQQQNGKFDHQERNSNDSSSHGRSRGHVRGGFIDQRTFRSHEDSNNSEPPIMNKGPPTAPYALLSSGQRGGEGAKQPTVRPPIVERKVQDSIGSDQVPISRRFGKDVPVVEILCWDNVSRDLILNIEKTFEAAHISIHTLFLQRGHTSRETATKHMIQEGVKALMIIEPRHVAQGKVYLQAFEPNGDGSVRYDEYDSITVKEAVVVVQQTLKKSAVQALSVPSAPFHSQLSYEAAEPASAPQKTYTSQQNYAPPAIVQPPSS